MTDPTNAREATIDTEIAKTFNEWQRLAGYTHAAAARVERARDFNRARMEADHAEYAAKSAAAYAVYTEADAQYEGWARFFLVKNTNGHIHSTMNCSTCNWDTRFGWLTDMSGLTETDAVAAHGQRLCSVCFPTAPVEWRETYYADEKKARKAERAEARAAKTAAKVERDAKRAETHHYFVRFYRASDGAVMDHNDRWRTLKACTKECADYGNYNGRHVVVDANTGDEVA